MGSLEGPTGPPEEEFSIANVIRLKSSGTWPLYNFSTFQIDARRKGYGQCSYLRFQNDKGRVHSSFLIFWKSNSDSILASLHHEARIDSS